MKYKVIENHRTEYTNSILLSKGEKVFMGEESYQDWPNWIFCTKLDKSNSGCVPKQIIENDNDFGVIIENYSAKELNINIGTIVEGIKELNGLLWIKNLETSEIGWVPLKKLEKLLV